MVIINWSELATLPLDCTVELSCYRYENIISEVTRYVIWRDRMFYICVLIYAVGSILSHYEVEPKLKNKEIKYIYTNLLDFASGWILFWTVYVLVNT